MRPSAVINGPLLHFEDETRKHILYFRKMIGHREAFFTLDNNSRTTEQQKQQTVLQQKLFKMQKILISPSIKEE